MAVILQKKFKDKVYLIPCIDPNDVKGRKKYVPLGGSKKQKRRFPRCGEINRGLKRSRYEESPQGKIHKKCYKKPN